MGMRLMNRDLKRFELYKPVSVKSGYVGTVSQRQKIAEFYACQEHVTDALSVQLYGDRVTSMIRLTVLKGQTEIKDGYYIAEEAGGAMYKVISVLEYSEHIIVTAQLDDRDTRT